LGCRCLGGDVDEHRWLRGADEEDGMEATCSRLDATSAGPAAAAALRQRGGETAVVVVATPGGGRTFIARPRSRAAPPRSPTTAAAAIELTTTSHRGGLATATALTPAASRRSVRRIRQVVPV